MLIVDGFIISLILHSVASNVNASSIAFPKVRSGSANSQRCRRTWFTLQVFRLSGLGTCRSASLGNHNAQGVSLAPPRMWKWTLLHDGIVSENDSAERQQMAWSRGALGRVAQSPPVT